jgi:Holliday junction resolvase
MRHSIFKKYFSFPFFFLVGLNLVVAQEFQGKITITNNFPHTFNTHFTIKNEMAMLETETSRGYVKMINNTSNGDKITLTVDRKTGDTIAFVKNSNDIQYRNLHKKYSKKRSRTNSVIVKVTRETKKVNGYKCYKVVASDHKFEGEAWITKKFEIKPYNLFPTLKSQQRSMPRVAKALQNSMEGFVMAMSIKNLTTKEVNTRSVTVKKQKLDDKEFQINMETIAVYNEETVRELMKEARGNPSKMKKARILLAQIQMQ